MNVPLRLMPFIIAALFASQANAKAPSRIAVYKLDGAGMDDRVMRLVEVSLIAEVRKLQHSSAISMDEVKSLLEFEAAKQLVGCTDESCLAEIAEALGADFLIVGGAVRVADRVTVSLKRVALETAAVTHTFTKQLTFENGEETLAVVGPAVETLFPDLELRPGQTRGVDPKVSLRLNPPPLPPLVFWSGTALTASLATATVATGVLWFLADSTLQSTFSQAKTEPVPATVVLQQQDSVRVANAAFWAVAATTAVVLVGTAFTFPFTDFDDAGGDL